MEQHLFFLISLELSRRWMQASVGEYENIIFITDKKPIAEHGFRSVTKNGLPAIISPKNLAGSSTKSQLVLHTPLQDRPHYRAKVAHDVCSLQADASQRGRKKGLSPVCPVFSSRLSHQTVLSFTSGGGKRGVKEGTQGEEECSSLRDCSSWKAEMGEKISPLLKYASWS